MEFRIGKAGPLVVALVGAYVAIGMAQSRAAAKLCERYSAGTLIEDVENLEGTFFLTRRGPIDPRASGAQESIFCASWTMCDTSCSLKIENHVVETARFSDF